MPNIISVTEAARNFSDIINRVNYQGQTFLLTRGGKVVARLTGAEKAMTGEEFLRLWQERPRLDPDDAALWEDELTETQSTVLPPEDQRWDS